MALPPPLDQQQPPPPPPPSQVPETFQSNFDRQYPNPGPTMQQTFTSPPLIQPEPVFYNDNVSADDSLAFKSPDPFYNSAMKKFNSRYQILLDTITPFRAYRWAFSLTLLMIFMIRIVVAQGWYVICYGLAIYYLNLFIGFLSPKIDPAESSAGFDDDDDGPMLPTRANDEFKPFIRRLPEFKFWLSATKATLISLFLTLFEVFDLPVFWPILFLYWLLLFISTMREQIKHMLKYGYVPWDKGKKRYGNKASETGSSLFGASDY